MSPTETSSRMNQFLEFAVFLPAASFPILAGVMGMRAPAMFDAPALLTASPLPLLLAIFAILTVFFDVWENKRIRDNLLPGLALALAFGSGYFLLATLLNKANLNTNNVFFAADSASWLGRMAAPDGAFYSTRAVHPLAHLIFRPLIFFLLFLTNGNGFHAVLLALASAGAGCVFVAWKIAKIFAPQPFYAVWAASTLGFSSAHLLFGSVIETYIFSALSLLALTLFALDESRPLKSLIWVSVLTFGLTISNFGQSVLITLFARKNLKQSLLLIVTVLALAAGLNIINVFLYPNDGYFFIPANLLAEQKYAEPLTPARAGLGLSNLLLYNVAAPQPYFKAHADTLPRFNFLPDSLESYTWFGFIALLAWILLLAWAFFEFGRSLKQPTRWTWLSAALLLCLGLNFGLHLTYGLEPFLYAADWTYALLLFVAINLRASAEKVLVRAGLLVFLGLLMLNNLWFIYLMIKLVEPFFS